MTNTSAAKSTTKATKASKDLQAKKPSTKKTATASKPDGSTRGGKSSTGSFVVTSCAAYPADGFHSYEEPDVEIDSTHATVKAANTRVRALFRKQSPYGVDTLKELIERGLLDETQDRHGLLTLSIAPEDSQEWTVSAKKAKAT